MPNDDFQDRLNRIRANARQRVAGPNSGISGRTGARSMNRGTLIAGAVIMAVGLQSIKFVNAHYDSMKESNGLGLAMGSGIAALGAVILGLVVMYRSVRPKLPEYSNEATSPLSSSAVPSARSMNRGTLIAGAVIMAVGFQSIKFVNAHYDSMKESNGLGLAMGSGIAAFGAVILGLVVMYRSARPKLSASTDDASSPRSSSVAQSARRPSKLSRAMFSLFGFVLGATASLYMYMVNAAKTVDTEAARLFSNGGLLIALALTLLCLLIGIVGLFVSRYPMRRVPVFFLLGGMLVFSGFRGFRIHPVDWPQFMALMQ